MKAIYLLLMVMGVSQLSIGQTTYTWNSTGTASWATSTNWTPTRTTPAANDILQFNNGATTTVTAVPTQTVGKIVVSGNTTVNLQAAAAATVLTISGGASALSVAGGSNLNVNGTNTLNINVATGSTGSITGNMTFSAAAHTLTAADASGITFNSPSVFTASTGFTGNAFGASGTTNTVIFSSGTTYVSAAGANPFGLTQPNSKVVFQTGSLFRITQNSAPGINGRTYANFEVNGATFNQSVTGSAGATFDNITITTGVLNLNTTGASAVTIKGNISVATGQTLTFSPASASTLTFNGTAAQSISNSGTLTFAANEAVVIANTAGNVTFNNNQTISGSMTVNANATLATTGVLTLSGTPTINGTFQINQGGWSTGGTWSYGANGTLAFNNSSGSYGVNADVFWPTTNGPVNVNVKGAGGITMNVSRTVSGTFQTAAGVSGSALTINGTNQINAGGFFNTTPIYGGSSTLVYNSGATYGRSNELTTGTGIPANITINSGSALDYGSGATGTARTLTGNLNVNGGFYMDFGSNDMTQPLTVNGNVSIGTAGTLSLSDAAGGDIKVGGNWTISGSGTFNPKTRAVFFINSGTSTITTASTASFDYLIIDKSSGGSAVLASNAAVANTLTLTNGNLSIGANTLTLNGSVARTSGNIAGGNTSNLVVNAAAGSLFFASGGTSNYLKALTIGASGSATLGNDLNITDYDGTSAEGVLTVTSGGSLNANGFLTIKSSANGSGRIAAGNTAGGYITGNVTVERFIRQNSSKGWRLLASNTSGQTINQAWQEGGIGGMVNPVPGYGTMITKAGASLGAVQANGFDTLSLGTALFQYNPTTDNLDPVTATNSGNIASQHGYFLFIRGDRSPGQFGAGAPTTSTTLRSKGTLFLGDQSSVSTGAANWGLVRNPYPSKIDMRNIVRGGSLVDAYQVWDAKLGGSFGVGGYQTFTKNVGTGNYEIAPGGGSYGGIGTVNNFIESGAAFFIQSSGGTGTAQVTEACKTSGSSAASFRPVTPLAGNQRMSFTVYAQNPGSEDIVDGGLVYFDNLYSNNVDVDDVRKSPNFGENFGMLRAATSLVVEKKQPISLNDTVFFDMNQLRQINYRIEISTTDFDPLITTAILQDKYTGNNTNIDLTTATSYVFTVDANAASKAADRFRLVFRQSGVVPVTFVSVRAAQANSNVQVEWKVANQLNIVRYEIEKSADGRSFSKAGTVLATAADLYNFMDMNVVAGNNYYRIKSVDNSGVVKYSAVVKVLVGSGKAGITVSPNPVQGNYINLQFANQAAGKYGVRIINIAGQTVYKREMQHNGGNASESFTISSGLASGIYQLEITAPDNSKQVQKIIINQGN